MERFFSWPQTIAFNREGPLGSFMDELAQHFIDGGYTGAYAADQLRIAAEFSHWLSRQRVTTHEIQPDHVQRFLRHRARTKVPRFRHPVIFALIYDLLRRKGLIAHLPPTVVRQTPVDKLISEFRLYLSQERHLANATVIHYAKDVSDWLRDRFGDGPAHWRTLSVADMTKYITRRASEIARKTAKTMVSGLRAYLQFARYRGYLRQDLASSIPPFAHWSTRSIPRGLPREHMQRVVACCNRQTAGGRRDYAILLLLARLGLRGGEVASLELDDVDWKEGRLAVRGKGGQEAQLPLPHDVGKAIVAYLKRGRPRSSSRRLFLRAHAPTNGLKGAVAIACLVKRALMRAKIDSPSKGAHQFRYGLATEMLRRGASLADIGELLRHRHPQTTSIYAKVDLNALRPLALPWPGGAR